MKNAIKILWLLFLVTLPAAILVTGWEQGLTVMQYGVTLYAVLAIAAVIAIALTIYSAKHWRGEDFGEKHHNWLLERYAKDIGKSTFESKFHVLRAVTSAVFLLAIGLPICATLVVLVSVAFLITEGAIASYYNTYGQPATTAGRTRSANP